MSGAGLTEKQRTEYLKILEIARDFNRYCQLNLKIRDKSGKLVPLVLNDEQQYLVSKVLDDIKNNRPIRYIILKGRQQGISTIVEALIMWFTSTNDNIKSKIVAHDRETAGQLYEMFRRYYDNANPIFKPQTKYNTKTDLTFDNEQGTGLKSQIDVASAGNTGIGRGQTIQWLHGSEVSLWADGEELVAGLMQAVPFLPSTAIFIESTANGIGDYFHKTWQAAKAGQSVFTPLFFPWSMHKEYRIVPPHDFQVTEDERALKEEYKLDNEQLYWRRMKLKEFAGNIDKFKQEYPINDVEAFLASGRSRFHIPSLLAMEEKAVAPRYVEIIEHDGTNNDLQGGMELITLDKSPFALWKEPQQGKRYIIGADVAEGVGGDYSVATIMEEESTETVARWRGDIEPHEFGEVLEQLGRYYNGALIACEVNNHGLTTIQRLRDLNYDNLYRRERGLEERFEEHTSSLGWKTDRKTKPLAINGLAEAILTHKIKDPDIMFIRECMSYVIDDRGRTNAQQGQHDDTVMSTAIALQVFDWTDVNLKRREVPSYIPQHALEIKKRFKGMLKGGARV